MPAAVDRLHDKFADIAAGLSLVAIAIPQALAYTNIAGTPVITGLYTILLPSLLFAIFGSSRHLVVGADSATAAVMAYGLTRLGFSGMPEYASYASVLAIVIGCLLLITPLLNLGFLSDFLSRTVLVGFLTGVGIQIAAAQIPEILGAAAHTVKLSHPLQGFIQDILSIPQTNYYTLALSTGVFIVIYGLRKISRKMPGSLIALILSIALSYLFNFAEHGIAIIGVISSGIPMLKFLPIISWNFIEQLLPIALSIMVVIIAQSTATARSFATRFNEPVNGNRDLLGLGLANLGAGLSGGFVVNGSPTGTQAVVSAGGRSQLSQIISAFCALIVLLFFTSPLAYLPKAVLATMVMIIGIDLIDVKGLHQIYYQSKSEFWIACLTAAFVFLLGVEPAIVLAIILSLLDHTRRGYRPKNHLLALDNAGHPHPVPMTTRAQMLPGLSIYRFNHSMYYANSNHFSEEVIDLVHQAEPPLAWFCLDAVAIDDIDYSAAETLREIYLMLKSKGIRLVLAEVAENVQEELHRFGLTNLIGKDSFFTSAHEVEKAFLKRSSK